MLDIYRNLPHKVQESFKRIKLIATDFDGVLTDNSVLHDQNGVEAVRRSRADSQGIDLLSDAGLYQKADYRNISRPLDVLIMSRETNPVVKSVGEKIKVKCLQGKYTKIEAFKREIEKRGLTENQAIYIGNDYNDINCISYAGLGVAVADAMGFVISSADYVTTKNGGNGAFREICELLLIAQDKHPYFKK